MSNQVVGSVYEAIIQKVIAASKNDFDEFGVDQSTLDEMKQGWQDKLSELKIAAFPWDPQVEPPRQQQPPTVPSNVKSEADVSPAVSAPQHAQLNFPNVPIKSERGYDPPMSAYQQAPVNTYSSGYNGDVAQQRAHALVQQRLIGQQGQQGNPAMQHMQQQPQHPQHGQGQMHPQQRMMPQQGQRPQQPPHQQQMTQQMAQQMQQQQMPQQMQQQRPPPGHVYTSQTDGSDGALEDWRAFMKARAAAETDDGPEGRLAADQLMRTQIEAMAARTEGCLGGPLSEMPKGKKRRAINRVRQAQQMEAASSSSAVPRVAPFDGDDETEENPEDAINSDLDDPEDDVGAGDNSDDDMVDYMLCTYDKVQRVKNKWKCTLKDGILTTNKKEYLFHKANGEFEW